MNPLDTQYADILRLIKRQGHEKDTRNGKTKSIFGVTFRHDMKTGFPLLTTKKMAVGSIMNELRWFLTGSTDIRDLWEMNVSIWDGDWYKNYRKWCTNPLSLQQMKTIAKNPSSYHDTIWDLGPIYGSQWKNFDGIDQIKQVLEKLRNNPDDRAIMVSAWNPSKLEEMTLRPCHYGFQLFTRVLTKKEQLDYIASKPNSSGNKPTRAISLLWNQRSVDTPLGLPFNIASYAMLLELFAAETGMLPDELIGNLGDTHIYENQMLGVDEQLSRDGYAILPTIKINHSNILAGQFDYTIADYRSCDVIKFPLSN